MPSLHSNVSTPVSTPLSTPINLVRTPVTNTSLSPNSFKDQHILHIIHSLNINKAHGHDDNLYDY